MAFKLNAKVAVAVLIALLFVVYILNPKTSAYTNVGGSSWGTNMFSEGAPTDVATTGWGVSTSMLPREIPSQEDFGNFSPDDIMKGQTYLDPRSQIGYPETTGGVLRNASWDLRSEPPNPRNPVSIFNNSTISPDLMKPRFEIER
jgi:hypothetical protein